MLRQAQHERIEDGIAVEATDLVKDFGDTRAVDGVSLKVSTGTIYGLLGPNGAGKTTTLRMLLGIIDPSSGSRLVLGRERPLDAAPEIGYLPEERGLYKKMKVGEQLRFFAELKSVPGKEADNEYIRVERPVRLASGQDILAWVYLYQWDVTGLDLVADGRWVASHP